MFNENFYFFDKQIFHLFRDLMHQGMEEANKYQKW